MALAGVEDLPPFAASVFTSQEQFEDELGPGYDITQVGRLAENGIAFAIDGGGTRVMTFDNVGGPIVVATKEAIGREADTTRPAVSSRTPPRRGGQRRSSRLRSPGCGSSTPRTSSLRPVTGCC